MRATIKIKNLALRTVVGFNEWERNKKQDVLLNVEMEFEAKKAVEADNVKDSVDYKKIKNEIIAGVEASNFNLLETLANYVLKIIMDHPQVLAAKVEVDKPHSLRFAKSVSVVVSAQR
jgi:D-erythro-7,8-dihydroneopterin triphosphate epimerase